ncbi:MAG: aldo/keto reductase [Bacteroidales bacterium]|nr:aldo/keto reductase [Bacteroidales bacterium]
MDRRQFIKTTVAGAGALAASSAATTLKAVEPAGDDKDLRVIQRTNAKNGDKVSLLGFGCMRWPMKKGDDGRDHIDQEIVNSLVDYAWNHGVNYYDTSPAYLQGQSEAALGEAISRYPRDSYYLATKLSNFGDASEKASLKMYRDSFENLRTDYIDYYLLHAIGGGGYPVYRMRYEDNHMMEFLLKEREAGRIRNLGFSFHGPHDAFDEFMKLHDKYHWDFVQIEMNYLDWRHAKEPRNTNAEYLYEELDKRNIPIVVMEPLLGGRLAKMAEGAAGKLLERDPSRSIASWAFRFVGSYPGVLCALSGMTNMEVLEENVQTFGDFKPLTEEEIDFLMEIAIMLDSYPTVPCNDCKYCMPCPYGIDIPGIFLHYNEMVNTGKIAVSREQKDYQKLRRRYLISYDRAVESLRQADHCIHCGTCVPHCPQSIEIPNQLQRIGDYVEKLKRGEL